MKSKFTHFSISPTKQDNFTAVNEKEASEAQPAMLPLSSGAETSLKVVDERAASQLYTKIRSIENGTVLETVNAIAEGNDLQSAAQEYLVLTLWQVKPMFSSFSRSSTLSRALA